MGSYNGGGTIVGFGARWSDSSDFPSNTPTPLKKKKRRKKRKQKNPAAGPTPQPKPEKPLLATRQLGLVRAVMSDLGRTLPRKTARLNAAIRALQADDIVLHNGELNKKHPELLRWLDKMEKTKSD